MEDFPAYARSPSRLHNLASDGRGSRDTISLPSPYKGSPLILDLRGCWLPTRLHLTASHNITALTLQGLSARFRVFQDNFKNYSCQRRTMHDTPEAIDPQNVVIKSIKTGRRDYCMHSMSVTCSSDSLLRCFTETGRHSSPP